MALNQQEHCNQSWWNLSQGWPGTREHAHLKWVFCNKANVVPYGSYVLDDANGILRVEKQEQLNTLNERFRAVYNAIKEEVLNGKR